MAELLFGWLADLAHAIIDRIMDAVSNAVSWLLDKVAQGISFLFNTLRTLIEAVYNTIAGVIGGMISRLVDFSEDIVRKAVDFLAPWLPAGEERFIRASVKSLCTYAVTKGFTSAVTEFFSGRMGIGGLVIRGGVLIVLVEFCNSVLPLLLTATAYTRPIQVYPKPITAPEVPRAPPIFTFYDRVTDRYTYMLVTVTNVVARDTVSDRYTVETLSSFFRYIEDAVSDAYTITLLAAVGVTSEDTLSDRYTLEVHGLIQTTARDRVTDSYIIETFGLIQTKLEDTLSDSYTTEAHGLIQATARDRLSDTYTTSLVGQTLDRAGDVLALCEPVLDTGEGIAVDYCPPQQDIVELQTTPVAYIDGLKDRYEPRLITPIQPQYPADTISDRYTVSLIGEILATSSDMLSDRYTVEVLGVQTARIEDVITDYYTAHQTTGAITYTDRVSDRYEYTVQLILL